MTKFALNLGVNGTSLGAVATLLLRSLYEKEKKEGQIIDWYLFPIGGVDLSAQKKDADFEKWIHEKIFHAYESYNRSIPIFKIWHIADSISSFSKSQVLLTYYELDKPTRFELNTAKNNKICFTSKFTQEVFKTFGVDSNFIAPAFDSYNFSKLDKKYHTDDRIVFNLCGKAEKRKHHGKIIQSWIKKYGNNRKYVLQCAIYNQHLNEQQNNQIIGQIVGGNKPFNVIFYPKMQENVIYNDFLNSGNIILGMSGGEAIGLPEFQSVALGKHAVIMNAHGYKTWANEDNAVLVNPNGKEEAYDGIFFRQGDITNQGNLFVFGEEDFFEGCEKAIARFQNNPENTNGLKLQKDYAPEKFSETVIDLLKTA